MRRIGPLVYDRLSSDLEPGAIRNETSRVRARLKGEGAMKFESRENGSEGLEVASGQQSMRFEILGACSSHDVVGERRCRRSLVPVESLEVIPNELLVERIGRSARLVSIGRPEA